MDKIEQIKEIDKIRSEYNYIAHLNEYIHPLIHKPKPDNTKLDEYKQKLIESKDELKTKFETTLSSQKLNNIKDRYNYFRSKLENQDKGIPNQEEDLLNDKPYENYGSLIPVIKYNKSQLDEFKINKDTKIEIYKKVLNKNLTNTNIFKQELSQNTYSNLMKYKEEKDKKKKDKKIEKFKKQLEKLSEDSNEKLNLNCIVNKLVKDQVYPNKKTIKNLINNNACAAASAAGGSKKRRTK